MKKIHYLRLLAALTALSIVAPLWGQPQETSARKQVEVRQTETAPKIDGAIEELWLTADSACGFTDISVKRCSFAHVSLATPIYRLAKKMEPFVEERMPFLAYNLCANGIKPE
jgi:hypothetical protein